MARYVAWTQRQPTTRYSEIDCAEYSLTGGRAEMFSRQRLAALRAFFTFLGEEFEEWRETSRADHLESLFDEARKIFFDVLKSTKMRTEAESKEIVFLHGLREAIRSGRASINGHLPGSPMVASTALYEDENGDRKVALDVLPMTAVDLVGRITGC